jgi:hypothetical protein
MADLRSAQLVCTFGGIACRVLKRAVCDQGHMVLFEYGYTVLDRGFLKMEIRGLGRCHNREWVQPFAPRREGDMQAWNEMVLSCIQWVGADVAN